MISSIVFVNAKGEILIYRTYKDGITRADLHNFCTQVIARKENKELPIINIDGANFIHISSKDVSIVATTESNVNAAMVLQFLYTMVNLYRAYFGGEFDESQVRKHFVLIYELLDEVMDYGVPQFLEPDLLKQYIIEGGMKVSLNELKKMDTLAQVTGVTGAMSWRAKGIFYKKNEVYLDVIENVNVILSNQGTVLKADVRGQIKIKSQLSGMPELKFGLNDRLLMENESRKTPAGVTRNKGVNIDDFKFHQCVKLGQFDKQRAITFVPPDGEFELMSYRISENVNLPFKIMPVVDEIGTNRIEMTIKLKALYEKTMFGNNIVVKIPCPRHTAVANTSASVGKAKYEPENGYIAWRIRKFQGETETLLRCSIQLLESTERKHWGRPPITMDFQVPMFTASGLRVRFLRISETSGYQTTKWICYSTKAGDYQHRI